MLARLCSVEVLADPNDFRQGSKVNTGLHKRSAIIRGNYRLLISNESTAVADASVEALSYTT